MWNQQTIDGRRISVQYSHTRGQSKPRTDGPRPSRPLNEPSNTLFIGNMAFDMTDQDLNNLFAKIKNVADVRVAIDRRTGQPRGFAHAEFYDVESAKTAMQLLKDTEVKGRVLRLDFSTSTPRPSMANRNDSI